MLLQRYAATRHICRATSTLPWAVTRFGKGPGRKEARTREELDGRGLTASKLILVHDRREQDWVGTEQSYQCPMS